MMVELGIFFDLHPRWAVSAIGVVHFHFHLHLRMNFPRAKKSKIAGSQESKTEIRNVPSPQETSQVATPTEHQQHGLPNDPEFIRNTYVPHKYAFTDSRAGPRKQPPELQTTPAAAGKF
mmetsp:Transcript_2438/g.4858  ORF Transcript_2438/g.4858 Transcript_2438/m.4858 type:complete len:119 (+) Transcript_2438:1300-1656(+)